MGRTFKSGITFYRMNTGHITNKKVRLLFNEFRGDGYYIWKCLIDYGYKIWGYYYDMNDEEELELFASEYCKMPLTLVKEVIAGCIRRGLFDKDVADVFGILTSVMMQETYLIATKDRREKGTEFEIFQEWYLIDPSEDIPRNLKIVPGNFKIDQPNNPHIRTDNTQKKSRGEKKNVAPDKPSPTKKINSVPPEEKEPYWALLVEAWFDFNEKQFQEKPSFKDRDPKFFKKIIELLKKRAESKKLEWSEHNSVASLKFFLSIAMEDTWLAKNFLLENLLKQFDKVYMQQNKKVFKPAAAVEVITQYEIDYLVERHKEGSMLFNQLKIEHYEYLAAAGQCFITESAMSEARNIRIKEEMGTNKGEMLRLIQAYQENKDTTETQNDLPKLLNLAKRIAAYFYIDNCKAEALKQKAS